MLVANTLLVDAQSMGATFTSSPFRLKFMDRAALQAVWTGTPVGDFTLELSCDQGTEEGQTIGGLDNWTTWTGSTVAAGGAAGNNTWDVTTSAKWVRVVYTCTSGTGTCSVRVNAKGAQ